MIDPDAIIVCGSDHAYEQAQKRFPGHVVLRRDYLTDEDEANWTRMSLRQPAALCVDASFELEKQVTDLSYQLATNALISKTRSRTWAEHLLANLPLLSTSPVCMMGTSRGMPAFIVGNGPSLNKNKADLPYARKTGIVVAVNGASKHCDAHLELCIESNDIRHKLAGTAPFRAFGLHCDPAVMNWGTGQLLPIWTGEIGSIPEQITGLLKLQTCASGTTAAISLAHSWGCNPIVLVGQDLAWTEGQIYSDGGTVEVGEHVALNWGAGPEYRRADALPKRLDLETVPAWGGGEVATSPQLTGVRRWLEQFARLYGHETTLINATEGGSHIQGWGEVALRSIGLEERKVRIENVGPPVPARRIARWAREEMEVLMDAPTTSMLLDYFLADDIISTLEEWRGYRGNRPTKAAELEPAVRELIAAGAEELRERLVALVDDCSAGKSTQG